MKHRYPYVVLFLVMILLPGFSIMAQKQKKTIMTGLQGGPLFFFGDIGSMGMGYFSGISGSFSFSKDVLLQFSLNYGTVSDSDEGTPNSARDYAFTTDIIEPGITVFYAFFTRRGKGFTNRGLVKQWDKWTGFVFAGVTFPIFKVVPGRHLTASIMDRDKGFVSSLSAGAALQYGLDKHWYMRLKINPHIVLSDYLDGYSSENSTANDIYHHVSLGIFYRF